VALEKNKLMHFIVVVITIGSRVVGGLKPPPPPPRWIYPTLASNSNPAMQDAEDLDRVLTESTI
jgi:hypothetical protein